MTKQVSRFNNQLIWTFDLSADGTRIVMDRGAVNYDVLMIRDLH